MEEVFQELVKFSQAECAVCFSSATEEILCRHRFVENSPVGKQVLRLLKRVSKVKEIEYCRDVGQDPLFRAMGISGAFACYPMMGEDDIVLGAIYVNSRRKDPMQDDITKAVRILTETYYQRLRNETRREVESQSGATSQRLKRYLSMGMSCEGRKIVGIDPIMEEQVFSLIEMYKSENCSPILILGESGTGKELVASAFHYKSERRDEAYIRFNCAEAASLDPQMQRVELFGCKAGIAPGVAERKGLFVLANRGTLFLDEIGLLGGETQGQLLRVLEDGKARPVGEKNDTTVDVRLICANNQPLQELVKEGKFREDLFYRICSFVVHIPPLRQRGISDHNLLIDYFIDEENRKTGNHKATSPKARALLHKHHWPGNVRELRATLRRAYYKVAKHDGIVGVKDIEFMTHEAADPGPVPRLFPEPWQKLADIERETFLQAARWAAADPKERTQGRAAEMLGVHPNTMTKKLRDYGISWPK